MDDLLATLQGATGQQQPTQAAPSAPVQQSSGFDPNKSYGTPSKLLDNLTMTESSKDPLAVNKTTGAMGPYQFMPATLAMMRKQGIKFDPFDPVQARNAADYYIQKLKSQNGGTYQGALKAYGGFVKQDPSQYIAKVMNGVDTTQGTTPGQSSVGQKAPVDNGPMSDLFSTLQSAPQQPKAAAPAAPVAQQPQKPAPAQSSGPLAQFGQGAVALADTALGAPGAALSQGEYAVRRALGQSPEQAQAGSENGIGAFFNQPVAKAVNGIGRLFGDNTDIRNTAGYQGEASQRLMGAVGQGIQAGSQAVSNATGIPVQDVSNMAQTGLMAVPALAKRAAPVIGEAAVATAADDTNFSKSAPPKPTGPAMQERVMAGGGAASAQSNPYPVFTGEESARGQFPQVKSSKVAQDVTPAEQSVRAGIVNEIMGENAGQARTGVLTGNENKLRDEHAAAKSPQETPANQAMKAQMASEQNALSNYAQERVNATGANPTLINNEQRGNVINDAFTGPDGLSDYFRQAKQQIYDQARQTSGDNPIKTTHVDELLKDPQFLAEAERSGNSGTVSGITKLMDLARNTGFKDQLSGSVTQPGSVAAWDAIRKSNNADWTPEKARTIGAINRAIDQDIAAAAGSEAYKLGDAIHRAQQNIMGAPAFKKVFGEADSNGISSGVAAEQIPGKLNNMRLDQWRHIYNTLDDLSRGQISGAPEGIPAVPTELQQMAAAAKNEMQGALAREVYEQGASKAGVWNQNSVNKTLNSVVGEKILQTFPPDEVAKFHTLNYGGQIMPGVHSYEGAAQQAARLNKPGFVEKYAPSAGAAVGGAIGHAIPVPGAGVLGTLGGTKVGGGIGKLAESRRASKQLESLNKELRANSQKGLDRLR